MVPWHLNPNLTFDPHELNSHVKPWVKTLSASSKIIPPPKKRNMFRNLWQSSMSQLSWFPRVFLTLTYLAPGSFVDLRLHPCNFFLAPWKNWWENRLISAFCHTKSECPPSTVAIEHAFKESVNSWANLVCIVWTQDQYPTSFSCFVIGVPFRSCLSLF